MDFVRSLVSRARRWVISDGRADEPRVLSVGAAGGASAHGWVEVDGALEREFAFHDFAEALAFVNRVGAAAEEADHHPDVFIHWNTVRLRWWTHAKNAITKRDMELARRTNELAGG